MKKIKNFLTAIVVLSLFLAGSTSAYAAEPLAIQEVEVQQVQSVSRQSHYWVRINTEVKYFPGKGIYCRDTYVCTCGSERKVGPWYPYQISGNY